MAELRIPGFLTLFDGVMARLPMNTNFDWRYREVVRRAALDLNRSVLVQQTSENNLHLRVKSITYDVWLEDRQQCYGAYAPANVEVLQISKEVAAAIWEIAQEFNEANLAEWPHYNNFYFPT